MIGIFSKTTDSDFVEAAGLSGLDFIILDREHGPASLETIHNHVRAARVAGIKSFVRVGTHDPNEIGSVLDSGADGVQVPGVTSADQARRIVEAAKFHPDGSRGVCRFVRAAEYGKREKSDYFSRANEAKVILQVEGKEGMEAVDDILGVDGYDVLFVGPYDLSQSLGIPGQVSNPKLIEMMKELSEKARSHDKKLGTFADEMETARLLQSSGFDHIAYSVDVSLFREACSDLVRQLSK